VGGGPPRALQEIDFLLLVDDEARQGALRFAEREGELDAGKAREIAAQVGKVVSTWRDEAARQGLTKSEIDRMASAFAHEDLRLAS
jgi:hypothetical protein